MSRWLIVSKKQSDITFNISHNNDSYKECLRLFNSLSSKEQEWLSHGNYKNSPYLLLKTLAYDGDKLVGFCDAIPYEFTSKDTAFLSICVDKKYRGQGIASTLVELMEKELSKIGYNKCIWKVNSDNTSSIKLAEKNNYIHKETEDEDLIFYKEFK